MNRSHFITVAALSGFLAVAIGAFGAHGLKPHLSENQLITFNTGNEYHFYHTLALLLAALLADGTKGNKLANYSACCFVLGILFFSGSLYLLATKEILGLGDWSPFLGPITPIGGLFFLLGWALLFVVGFKSRQ